MSRAGSTLFFLPSPWIRGCCRTFNPEVFYIKYPTSYRNQAQDHYIQARVAGRVGLGLSGPCTINPCPPMHQERRLANIVSPLISLPLSFSQRESMSRAPHKAFQTIIVKFQNSLITCIMYACNPSPILHTPLASKSEAAEIHQKTNHRWRMAYSLQGPWQYSSEGWKKGGA